MRVFISIDMPKDVKKELIKAQEDIDKNNAKLTLTKPQQLHLTLKFLGEIDEAMVDKIISILRKIKYSKFSTKLRGDIGLFPDEENPRVIYAGMTNETSELQHIIDNELSLLGFPKEKKFSPHITLARIKSINDKNALLDNLMSIKIENKKFQVTDFLLMKSTLTINGPIHEKISTFYLA